jgi:hypothetical protein
MNVLAPRSAMEPVLISKLIHQIAAPAGRFVKLGWSAKMVAVRSSAPAERVIVLGHALT